MYATWTDSNPVSSAVNKFSEDALKTYKDLLKPGVYEKLLNFFNTPHEVTKYSARGMSYQKAQIFPSTATGHSFYYSSDELPYVAKVVQPCYGQLGGVKPGQTNLYLWLPNTWGKKGFGSLTKQDHPFNKLFTDILQGMFNNPSDPRCEEFFTKYGWVLSPNVLNTWKSPHIAGFAMCWRSGFEFHPKDTMLDTLVHKMVLDGYTKAQPYSLSQHGHGYFCKLQTWADIVNQLTGKWNKSFDTLSSYAEDPDYSCWDSPINNLWSDHDVVQTGKFITGRATDMVWDEWVVRNPSNGDHWYGRNNGSSQSKNSGEVLRDVQKMLNDKEPKTAQEARDLVKALFEQKVREHGTNGNQAAAA